MFASQANGAARRLKQSHLGATTAKWSLYVGVHLRFAATDDRVLDITMLPQDFGQCMEVCLCLCVYVHVHVFLCSCVFFYLFVFVCLFLFCFSSFIYLFSIALRTKQ